mgnify:CR=1 FL=1
MKKQILITSLLAFSINSTADSLLDIYNDALEKDALAAHSLIETNYHQANYFKPELQKYFGIKLGSLTYLLDGKPHPYPNFIDYS